MGFIIGVILVVVILLILASCIRIVPQAQALVVERLGGYQGTWSVGVHFKVPFIDRVAKRVILKEQLFDAGLSLSESRQASPRRERRGACGAGDRWLEA